MVTLLIIYLVIMVIAHIAIFMSLPRTIRMLFTVNAFVGMIIDFGISEFVLIFTGVGNIIGIGNILGSVVFGLFLVCYKKYIGKVYYNFQIPLLKISNINKFNISCKSFSFKYDVYNER